MLLIIALPACSLALSGPPANRVRGDAPRCDTGKGMVALDAIAGTAAMIGGAAALSGNNGAAATVPLAIGTAFLLSALHGNAVVDSCRGAMDQYAEELRSSPPIAARPQPPIEAVQADAQVAPDPDVQPKLDIRQPAPPVPAAPVAPAAANDPWHDFWREVK